MGTPLEEGPVAHGSHTACDDETHWLDQSRRSRLPWRATPCCCGPRPTIDLWLWSIAGFLGLLAVMGIVGIFRPTSDAGLRGARRSGGRHRRPRR